MFAARFIGVRLQLAEQFVLSDVSFDLPAGRLSAIVGPNGCGKSSIARLLMGFHFPTSGVVEVLGHRLGEVNVHDLRRRVKLVQPSMMYEPDEGRPVRDIVLTGAFGTVDLYDVPSAADVRRTDALITQLGLKRVADNPFRLCSTGERMRTQLARSLLSRPELLILDEPTSGLDIPMREQLLASLDTILNEADSPAILLVTHHLEELPPSTSQVILMSQARVDACGTPADVLNDANLSRAFDFPLEVERAGGRFFARRAQGK